MNKAIGIIETIGMLPAVTALDNALKSANVELKEFNIVKSGIVTVIIEGDVAAVKSAVSAGVSAVTNMNTSVKGHVIARPIDNINIAISSFRSNNNSQIKKLISNDNFKNVDNKETKSVVKEFESKDENKIVGQYSNPIEQPQKTIESIKTDVVKTNKYTKDSLMEMNTSEIREICKGIASLDLSTSKLKKMKKEELIDIVLKEFKN